MKRQKVSLHNSSVSQIYIRPVSPAIVSGALSACVYFVYKGQKIRIEMSQGDSLSLLLMRLYRAVAECEKAKGDNKSKVLGFASADGDHVWDFALSVGKGVLENSKIVKTFLKKEVSQAPPYKILRCLAIGGFSKVYLVRSTLDGKFYAAKFVRKIKNNNERAERQRKSIVNQIDISRELKHTNIVGMHHAFETLSFFCMVYEYCPGGELFYLLKKVKKLREADARFYIIQILQGINYLHSKSIVYRDIKPENILIDTNGYVKIADFGLSKKMETRQKTFTYCGSAEYMAPEMILGTGHTAALDYYCIGALLYELVTGLPPFYKNNTKETHKSIINESVHFPSYLQLSEQIQSLIRELLVKDESLRLGTQEGIDEILRHRWFYGAEIHKICERTVAAPYPPNLNQLNFDVKDLGQDEKQFTNLVIAEVEQNEERPSKISISQRNSLTKGLYGDSKQTRVTSSPGYSNLYKSVSSSKYLSGDTSIRKLEEQSIKSSARILVLERNVLSQPQIQNDPLHFREKNFLHFRQPKCFHKNKFMSPIVSSMPSQENLMMVRPSMSKSQKKRRERLPGNSSPKYISTTLPSENSRSRQKAN